MNSSDELYLVLSNTAILPAVVYSFFLGLWPEFSLLTALGTNSTLYHLCQGNFFCIITTSVLGQPDFYVLQKTDEFFVNIAIVYFVMYFLWIPREIILLVVFLVSPMFMMTIFSGSVYTNLILGVVIGISVFAVLIYCVFVKEEFEFSLISGILALILLITGFVFFLLGGDPNESDNYGIYHGNWHTFLMLGLFFVIDLRYGYLQIVIDSKGIRLRKNMENRKRYFKTSHFLKI